MSKGLLKGDCNMISKKLISGVLVFSVFLGSCDFNINLIDDQNSNNSQSKETKQNEKNKTNQNSSNHLLNSDNNQNSNVQSPQVKKPIGEQRAIEIAKTYAQNNIESNGKQINFNINRTLTSNNHVYYIEFKNGNSNGSFLTYMIEVDKRAGVVLESYEYASDEEKKRYNEAKEQAIDNNNTDMDENIKTQEQKQKMDQSLQEKEIQSESNDEDDS